MSCIAGSLGASHEASVRVRSMEDRMKGVSGFTLIELLVVIAIIAILAAVFFRIRDRPGKGAANDLRKQ